MVIGETMDITTVVQDEGAKGGIINQIRTIAILLLVPIHLIRQERLLLVLGHIVRFLTLPPLPPHLLLPPPPLQVLIIIQVILQILLRHILLILVHIQIEIIEIRKPKLL